MVKLFLVIFVKSVSQLVTEGSVVTAYSQYICTSCLSVFLTRCSPISREMDRQTCRLIFTDMNALDCVSYAVYGGGLVRITVSVLLCDSPQSPLDRLQLISDCSVYLTTMTVNSMGLCFALTTECLEGSSLFL